MSLEKLFESWRGYINEEEKPALYTGAVVNDINKLLSRIPEEFKSSHKWIFQTEGSKDTRASHGVEQLNHHMTLVPSPANKSKKPLDEILNKTVKLTIIGFGVDETLGIAGWKVRSEIDSFVQSGVPHITAALKDKSVKPFLAAKIKDWQPVQEFEVEATVQEVFPKK